MNSKEIIEQYNSSVIGSYGRLPLALESGSGAQGCNADGNTYIDFGSGIGTNSLGYADSQWADAVSEQAHRVQHVSNYYYNSTAAEFAAKLTKMTNTDKIFFGNSGAEANECAIKIARKRSMGKAALVAGVSLALSSLSAMAAGIPSSDSYSCQSQVCDTTKRAQVFGEIHEQMPYFRGGERALMEYLQSHIKYPPEAVKDSIQGLVVVQLLIERNGSVHEVKVVRSVHELLDNEAIRVCKSLPKFYPGRVGGKAAAMWLTLPITFKLEGKSDLESTEEEPK